jgi:23S rRNA pseudouridine1911/1915/1917 synthase
LIEAREGLLFLYKPAGVPVFPFHDGRPAPSMLSFLDEIHTNRDEIRWPTGFEGGIAHRLDTATSGLLLAASTLDNLASLRGLFSEKLLLKRYLLLSRGPDALDDVHYIVVDAPMAHHPRRADRMIVWRGREEAHRGRWYPARTELRHVRGALWEATMRSGVTHQIRAHAAHAGLPLRGDALYGGEPWGTGCTLPPGVDFALHHRGVEGLSSPGPLVDEPGWWRGLPPYPP